MDFVNAVGKFISLSWDFFTEITVPGCTFTFGALFVGLFLAELSLRVLSSILGLSFNSGDIIPGLAKFGVAPDPGTSLSYRSSPGHAVAISDSRRFDQF